MAALLEYDVKTLLAHHGVRVPQGSVCRTRDDVRLAADEVGPAVAVKALVPSKGKQYAGGIHFADNPRAATLLADQLFHRSIAGFVVTEVLVEHRESVVSEIYVCVRLDGAEKSYALSVSAQGGVDVEAALSAGEASLLWFNADAVPAEYSVRDLLIAGGIRGIALREAPSAIVAICRTALECDATMLEINPLGLTEAGTCYALGVLATVDESALYRHPHFADRALLRVDQLLRPLTAWENAIDSINVSVPDGGDIRFGEFPLGDIGVMVLGGGAGLLALDAIANAGGKPANFFDMTSTTGNVEEKIYRITKSFLTLERLRGLFIGSNIGAFLPVSVRLKGIARALAEALPSRAGFPVVIRLAGIGDENAHQLLSGLPVTYFRDEVTLEDAVVYFMDQLGAVT
jgi:succinyl-CoA synthetase beta subunit/citryl-CoA synthetase large subunit